MILDLYATPEEVMRAVEALQAFGREKQILEQDLFGLALALEECGSNIVNHALARDPGRHFQVLIEHANNAMVIEVRDRGLEFDPTQTREIELAPEADDRPPGGWGIQLVRRYVDEIRYQRREGENILRLTKHLAAANTPK